MERLRTAEWKRYVTAPGVVAMLTASLGLAACSGNAPSAPIASGIRLVVEGRAERGAMVSAHVVGDGSATGAPVSWTSSQPWAVVDSAGRVRFNDTGMVTLNAQTNAGSTQTTLHVSAPPTVVFDMHDVGASGTLGDRNIYRVALDGHDLRRLSSAPADNVQPSAASGTVVFTSFRDGYPALYTVPLSGSARESRLTTISAPANQPSLSANGSALAYVVPGGITSGGPANPLVDKVWIAASDGSRSTRATAESQVSDGSVLEGSPSWAPGGDRLALVRTAQGPAEIEQLTLSSRSMQALTSGGTTTDVEPAWSPDGRAVAFTSTRDGDQAVFTLDVASSTVRRMSPAAASVGALDGQPTWLPDGRLVFTSWSFAGGALSSTLHWIDPTTPATVHDILAPAGMPEHAAAVR